MMKRSKKISAYLLLAVYLPMLLLASFHTHQPDSCCGTSGDKAISTKVALADNCLLCQFLHTPYEPEPQFSSDTSLPATMVMESGPDGDVVPAFTVSFASRAPPYLF